MADAEDTSQEQKEDADKKKKNILEEKSKEDLVILVKKYLNLLHKSKNKTDELNKKCSALEQEKSSLIEVHQSSILDLQKDIEDLQHSVTKLKTEKESLNEKIEENEDLKQKLKEALEDKKTHAPLMRENEEQLQCLNLQLQSLKASCQCIQEENLKLQKLLKEQSDDITSLTDKNATLSFDFNKKSAEYDLLCSVKENIEAKYEKGIGEIHLLRTKMESLAAENGDLQKNNTDLSYEIQKLVKSKASSGDFGVLLEELQNSQQQLEECKDENKILKDQNNNLREELHRREPQYATEKATFPPRHQTDNVRYTVLEQEKQQLEVKNRILESDIEKAQKQILELEEEIKNFSSCQISSDYKAGIEFALLHGARTESLIYPDELQSPKTDVPQPIEKSHDISQDNYPYNETSGLEFALLQGGDPLNFMPACYEPSGDVCSPYISQPNIANLEPQVYDAKIDELETKIDIYEKEKEKLVEKLAEFSSLCNDTIEENNRLKSELNKMKAKFIKTVHHKETNTESESLKKLNMADVKSAEESSQLKYCGNCDIIYSEIINFYEFLQSVGKFNSEQKLSSCDYLEVLQDIEKSYSETIFELEKNKSVLNEYNLQLELLVIGVKMGVRQKTSASSYQAKNSLDENVSALKLLLEDLFSRSFSFDSRLNQVHSQTAEKVQEMEDQLNQMRELNQFLEYENNELSSELEKFKSNQNDSVKHSTEFSGGTNEPNAELYSIEESSEIDDGVGAVLGVNLVKETMNKSDVSIQVLPSMQHSGIQIEADFYSKQKELLTDVSIQTDLVMETFRKEMEQLASDNEHLKQIADEKSNLVEGIHCQMDSLLRKVEDLTAELKYKEDNLEHLKKLNGDLTTKLSNAEYFQHQQINDLKIVQQSILDCKLKNSDLNEDVKNLSSAYKDIITNVNSDILNIIQQNFKKVNYLTDLCIHKENNLLEIQKWICDCVTVFEVWFNTVDQITPEYLPDMAQVKPTEDQPLNTRFENICDNEVCCCILEDINNLNSSKFKLVSALYNHLNNVYGPLSKNLTEYKKNIVPKLEEKIAELDSKIATCTSKSDSVAESMQEQPSEDALKAALSDAEVKMNKFKQIAVKLKKELAATKEQFSEGVLEKEKLQNQNSKLLDEQCKYVQNYQTLQNEFDKLQDECDLHNLNQKKLEDDLAAKLRELTSVKEQVLDFENQLKSSKHLLEINIANKKELESKCAELESKIIISGSKIGEKEQKINSLETDILKHIKDLNVAYEDIAHLKDELESALREGNKKSVLDLEMADYERSITELNNTIKMKESEIEDLQNEVDALKERNDCLHEELKSTETLKETEAKRAESLKDVLEKTKSDLNEAKEHETELLTKTASLEIHLETMTRQEEDFKIRQSEASAQIQHLQDVIKTSSENHQRIVRSLEQKISNQKEEIYVAHKEVESVKQEFENYKIRVHSVLKQQKSTTPAITTVDADLKEKLETVNEKLKLQVKELSEKLTAVTLEYDSLQEEHNSLLQRYDKVIDDREKKDKEWHQRLDLLNAEKSRLRATQEELSSQHLLQNEMLVATYKKQIKIMSDEHKKLVADLQKQLDAADVEISRLQRDQQKLQGLPVAPSPQETAASLDLLSQERQEGEGSESTDENNTPVRQLSLATIPTSGFLPFEKLIQSPVEPGTPASYVSNYDSEKLTTDLNTANKKIDHLSELLNDSESTNMRQSEQVRVLKEEVRRLENNKERQQHSDNLEYLKNVVIKFATLQPGSEKAMLVPVLTTILKLSSTEQQQLKSVAGDANSDDNMNVGWGSYLHRWSGLS